MIHHFIRRQSEGRWARTQKSRKVKDSKSELQLSFFSALFITFSITFFVYNTRGKYAEILQSHVMLGWVVGVGTTAGEKRPFFSPTPPEGKVPFFLYIRLRTRASAQLLIVLLYSRAFV